MQCHSQGSRIEGARSRHGSPGSDCDDWGDFLWLSSAGAGHCGIRALATKVFWIRPRNAHRTDICCAKKWITLGYNNRLFQSIFFALCIFRCSISTQIAMANVFFRQIFTSSWSSFGGSYSMTSDSDEPSFSMTSDSDELSFSASMQLTWNCWAVSTLLLAILAGGYIAFNVLEELDAGELASEAHEKLNWTNVVSLGFAFCFILSLGAIRPLKGGKGYDFKEHAPQELVEALSTSAQKLVKIAGMVLGAGSACFRLFADITALIDLYNGSDWSALFAKLLMLVLASSWAALWVYEHTPTHLDYMPPLALRGRDVLWLPPLISFLAFLQLLPVCLLLVCLIFFIFSDTVSELEKALDLVHVSQKWKAHQRASLLAETVPTLLLNMFLLNGSALSPASWQFLAISTFITGCSLIYTFAQIDERGHVSHIAISLVPGTCIRRVADLWSKDSSWGI